MAYPATTLDEAIALIISDGNLFGDIMRGDINTTVNVDGGLVPSVAKAIADSTAYRTQIAWQEGLTETDLVQLRNFNGGIYAPVTVPVIMTAAPNPDPTKWKIYLGLQLPDAPSDGNQYTRKDADWAVISSTFVALADSPASYTSQAAKLVAVKGTEDGVEFVDAPAGGLVNTFVQTGALADGDLFMVDSSVTRTRALPAGTDGDRIGVKDDGGLAGTNTITINPDGTEKIMGVNAAFTITTNFGYAEFVYKAADSDWRLVV